MSDDRVSVARNLQLLEKALGRTLNHPAIDRVRGQAAVGHEGGLDSPAGGGVSGGGKTSGGALERLRQKVRGLPPKKVESRDGVETGLQMVPGGAFAPAAYPSRDDWPDDERPPGSLHTMEAWQSAADGDAATNSVIEVLTGAGSVLIACPRSAPADPLTVRFGLIFDRCMIVTEDARPAFPGAVSARRHDQAGQPFWVIRPRAHYLATEGMVPLYCDARWTYQEVPAPAYAAPLEVEGVDEAEAPRPI